ncbi:MAG: hypothetical protein RI894_778 [Bacteroidota bacterium]|jgi:uncharacterized protein with ParB-like and HNH nuclease domain
MEKNEGFSPRQQPLLDLLHQNSYIIPSYQRPYSWGAQGKSNKNDQVNQMWEDLLEAFKENPKEIYFFGSMVTINKGERTFEVVDGQQRLTTISLLFAAMKCFYTWAANEKIIKEDDGQLAQMDLNAIYENYDEMIFNRKKTTRASKAAEKKIKIEKIDGYDYDHILNLAMTCTPTPRWKDAAWQELTAESLDIVKRYFENRDFFIEQFQNKENGFLDADGFLTPSEMERLDDFFSFVTEKIILVNIQANNIKIAYQIFEILNNRGLPLSSKDLFRNFLINKLQQEHEKEALPIAPITAWQKLEEYEFDSDFISRYVENKTGKKQRYSAFNDLEDIYNDEKSFRNHRNTRKIVQFYDDIEANLNNYTNIVRLSFSNPIMIYKVDCILQTGNRAISISLLMALLKNIQDEKQLLQFLKIYEQYVLYLQIAGHKRFKAQLIYNAIQSLNQKKYTEAIAVFELNTEDKAAMKNALNDNFKDNDIAKTFIARYYWALQEPIAHDTVNKQKLEYSQITLEHIIPQKPKEDSNWLTDFDEKFRKNYTYKLGNMTLLTAEKNSSAKNFGWHTKRGKYKQTNLFMTAIIAEQAEITPMFLENRQKSIVETLIQALDL